jgi:hypothetical protein
VEAEFKLNASEGGKSLPRLVSRTFVLCKETTGERFNLYRLIIINLT